MLRADEDEFSGWVIYRKIDSKDRSGRLKRYKFIKGVVVPFLCRTTVSTVFQFQGQLSRRMANDEGWDEWTPEKP